MNIFNELLMLRDEGKTVRVWMTDGHQYAGKIKDSTETWVMLEDNLVDGHSDVKLVLSHIIALK